VSISNYFVVVVKILIKQIKKKFDLKIAAKLELTRNSAWL